MALNGQASLVGGSSLSAQCRESALVPALALAMELSVSGVPQSAAGRYSSRGVA